LFFPSFALFGSGWPQAFFKGINTLPVWEQHWRFPAVAVVVSEYTPEEEFVLDNDQNDIQ
jgi:hypothetical protein